MTIDTLDHRRRRVRFRATHRGTKEADLLVGGYVAARVATMEHPALDAVEDILNLPDTDLADWLTGRRPIPADAPSLLLAMRAAALGRSA